MRAILLAVLASAALIAAGAIAVKSAACSRDDIAQVVRMSAPYGSKVIVTGCRAEDDCTQDYRHGKWIIRRHRH